MADLKAEDIARQRLAQSRLQRDNANVDRQLINDAQKQNAPIYNGYNLSQGGDVRATNGYIANGQAIATPSGFKVSMPARKPDAKPPVKKQEEPVLPHTGFLLIPDSDSMGDRDFAEFYTNILKWFCGKKVKTIYSVTGNFEFGSLNDKNSKDRGIYYAVSKLKLKVKEFAANWAEADNTINSANLLSELKKVDSLLFFPCFHYRSYDNIRIGTEFEFFNSDIRKELRRIAKKHGLIVSGEWAFKNNYLNNWYYVNKDWLKIFGLDNRIDCYADYQFYSNGIVNWGLQLWSDVTNNFVSIFNQSGEIPNNQDSNGIKKTDFIKASTKYKDMIGKKSYSMWNNFIGMFQSIPNTAGIKPDEIVVIDSTDYIKTIFPQPIQIPSDQLINLPQFPDGIIPESYFNPRCRILYLSPDKITL